MTCANCGTDNPEGARFCGGCGATLPAGAGAPPDDTPASTPAATPPTQPTPVVPPAGPPTAPIPPIPPGPPAGSTDPTYVGGMPPAPPSPPDPTTAFATAPGAPPPAAPTAKKSKRSLILGLIALLVVAALVASYFVFGGDDGDDSVEIVLEPIGQTIADDFAGNLDLRNFDASIANVLPDVPPIGSDIAAALSARRADGDTPGLYGGSRDQGTCDREQLVDFLTDEENADKAEAWAETLDIEVDEIEDFVNELTPMRLRFDTRVTNHGFRDGEANPFQSVLEAGTAVLVDDEGVPRVKCNCGNPLAEPEEVGDLSDDEALDAEALVQNPDDAWDEFDPELVVVVVAGDALDEFVLVDIDTGELFTRPVGTDGEEDGDVDVDAVCELLGDSPTCAEEPPDEDDEETTTTTEPDDEETTTTTVVLGTGDVQVTLEWGSNADLDLAVTDPTGEEINFTNRGPSSTGGQLDVDSNVGCPEDASSGVENIFWPPGGAPAGDYAVEVTGFAVDDDTCGGGDYVLTIRVEGADDQVIRDTVGPNETDQFDFSVG